MQILWLILRSEVVLRIVEAKSYNLFTTKKICLALIPAEWKCAADIKDCLGLSLLNKKNAANIKKCLGFSPVYVKYVLQYIDFSDGSLAFPKRISACCSTPMFIV